MLLRFFTAILLLFFSSACQQSSTSLAPTPEVPTPEGIFGVWNLDSPEWNAKLTLDIRDSYTVIRQRCFHAGDAAVVEIEVPSKVVDSEFIIFAGAERETARGLFGCRLRVEAYSTSFRRTGNQLEINFNGETSLFKR